MTKKQCPTCRIEKEINEFYLNKTREGGHSSHCKECSKKSASFRYYNNKEYYLEMARKRYSDNPDKYLKSNQKWAENNPEKQREISHKAGRRWKKNNPEKHKEGNLRWRKNNPEKLRAMRKRADIKKQSTPMGKLNIQIGASIRKSLNGNKNGRHWEDIVGYTLDQLKRHLEKQFLPGMSWENKGFSVWHIDHIIPISAFNFKTPECIDFKKCWSLENLRPLWAKENQKKYAKLTRNFQPSLCFT